MVSDSNVKIAMGGIIAIAIIVGVFSYFFLTSDETELNIVPDSTDRKVYDIEIVNSSSLFKVYAPSGAFEIKNGEIFWYSIKLELNPEFEELYDKIGVKTEPQNSVVVVPIFTASAYTEGGFYDYYTGDCDLSCLTISIQLSLRPEGSRNAIQVLNLLGYKFISDVDIDKNPDNLKKYDKVILLHSEYVTKTEFEAITSHPNVIYLYPNALYAEVVVDYNENTMTLVRGHGYPEPKISNGFGWEYENTPYEFDTDCLDMEFYRIINGWMLNCNPEAIIHNSEELIKMIKEF